MDGDEEGCVFDVGSKNDEIQGGKLENLIFFKSANVATSPILFYPSWRREWQRSATAVGLAGEHLIPNDGIDAIDNERFGRFRCQKMSIVALLPSRRKWSTGPFSVKWSLPIALLGDYYFFRFLFFTNRVPAGLVLRLVALLMRNFPQEKFLCFTKTISLYQRPLAMETYFWLISGPPWISLHELHLLLRK